MDFLRSKQSGAAADFTGNLAIASDVFNIDEVSNSGLPTAISTLSYDPVQSLLAVGTHETATISGAVHIFGQKRVHVVFPLPHKASVKILKLCDSKIVVLDSRNDLTVFDMEAPRAPGVAYSPPGVVTTIETDPCLDWCFLGLQSGETVVYDIDRECQAPLRIPNLWRERAPKANRLPVVSLQLHPKDVGRLLVGYSEGAVIYSIKQEAPVLFMEFTLPPGAPGADSELAVIRRERRPKLVQAVWHPTGTFVACTYEDSVLAIWNQRDGTVVEARTLDDTNVHIPGSKDVHSSYAGEQGSILVRQPIFRLAWCSNSNPDDTQLLIAGGADVTNPGKGLMLMDLGPSPNMLTSSLQLVSEHFTRPRHQRMLPISTEFDVVDFCMIPKSVLSYGGTHDAVAVIALLASGEIAMLKFPDGAPVSPVGLLPPALLLSHPKQDRLDVTALNRTRWLGMEPARNTMAEILVGGIEHPKALKRYENRTLMHSSHPNGTVRIWDLGHADEIENSHVLELNLARVLQRDTELKVTAVSMAPNTGETIVGMETGEVVVYRWGRNKAFGRTASEEDLTAAVSATVVEIEVGLINVQMRTDPNLKEGLLPYCMLDQKCGAVVALKMSDVGFVAVAYETGYLTVVDLRGPTIIYHESLASVLTEKTSKRASFRKPKDTDLSDKATILEFSIIALEHQDYSSLNLFIGTTTGRIITLQLLPAGATYTITPINTTSLTPPSPILSLHPVTSTGRPAPATPSLLSTLATAPKIPGLMIATTSHTARIFRPPTHKGASRTFEPPILSAGIADLEGYGSALITLTTSDSLRAYSLPGLKELPIELSLTPFLPATVKEATILSAGYIFFPEAGTLLQIFGSGLRFANREPDTLYNPSLPPPARPTISGLQWLSGTQYISTQDLDIIIGGIDRPMSRKQKMQLQETRAADAAAAREERVRGGVDGGADAGGGVFGDMAKNLRERTEQLGFAADNLQRVGENSGRFADDVGKFVKKKQRDVLWGGLKSKFF